MNIPCKEPYQHLINARKDTNWKYLGILVVMIFVSVNAVSGIDAD